MSTDLVKAEIKRFLASNDPEVLCVKGKWGVGKTYAWVTYLGEAEAEETLGLKRYSYVSLFGNNSLDQLKLGIVENTVTAGKIRSGPNVETLKSLISDVGDFGRKARPLSDIVLSFLGLGAGGEAIARASFFLVRDQIVCLDDLERAGDQLKVRDVLGLASMLKEQRNCKVVLLLNDEQMACNEREEFERQLEKVVDISLVFEPTPDEAIEISLSSDGHIHETLKDRCRDLQLTNIRVIKKIERLVIRVAEILNEYPDEIHEQAVATAALGGWAVFQPGAGPSMDQILRHNPYSPSQVLGDENQHDNQNSWRAQLNGYPFIHADDFDRVILKGIRAGFFDKDALVVEADKLIESIERNDRKNDFSKAWDLYHGSLNVSEDKVLTAMHHGAMKNADVISPMNMNSAVRMLRQFDRGDQADEVIQHYVNIHKDDHKFFELSEHVWGDGPLDDHLRDAFEAELQAFEDERNPKEVLETIAESQSWNPADEELLNSLSVEELITMLESIEGRQLRRSIEMAVSLGRRNEELGPKVQSALQQIAAKSAMNAERLQRYGIEPADDGDG